MLAACWFAVLKAGGIAVTTMPLLRARELATIIDKAQDQARAVRRAPWRRARAGARRGAGAASASARSMARADRAAAPSSSGAWPRCAPSFENVDTAADDVALIAFTSGTTGKPKGTMHFHRDVLAICDCFPRSMLKPAADDVFIGSPPFAFTFGLGGLLLFPMRFGASAVLLESGAAERLLAGDRALSGAASASPRRPPIG